MQCKAVQMTGLSVRTQRNRLRRHRPVLLHLQLQRSGVRRLERQVDFNLIGTRRLPVRLQLLACRILQQDRIHAARIVGRQMNRVLAPHDQRLAIRRSQFPVLGVRVLQPERRPIVLLESPIPVQRCVDRVAEIAGAQVLRFQFQATLLHIGFDHLIDTLPILRLQPQRHVVRIAGGENQRRAVDRKHQRIFLHTVVLLRIHRMQRRRLRRLHGRQRRHQH